MGFKKFHHAYDGLVEEVANQVDRLRLDAGFREPLLDGEEIIIKVLSRFLCDRFCDDA